MTGTVEETAKKGQPVVNFQTTETSQLQFIHHRVKTYNELPFSRQMVKTHNELSLLRRGVKTRNLGNERNPNSKIMPRREP